MVRWFPTFFAKKWLRPAVLALTLIFLGNSQGFGAAAGDGPASPPLRVVATGAQSLGLILAPDAMPGGEPVRILELRPFEVLTTGTTRRVVWEGRPTSGVIALPRYDGPRDRLYDKFQVTAAATGAPLGAAQYVTDLSALPARDFEIPWPKVKKGLTCVMDVDDAKALGVRYADDGVLLPALIDWRNPAPEATWDVDGVKVPINMNYVRQLDAKYRAMTDAGINFTTALINGIPTAPEPGNPLINPRTDLAGAPMHLGAFNLTDEAGLRCYRAAVEFLADRYTQPGHPYGLISGIIIGNELQSHWVWHNMGLATVDEVAHDYTLDLRIADLAARRTHRGLRVYVSLEHNWMKRGMTNNPQKECRGRELLTLIAEDARREGDFPWHLAFHPYPENLFEPAFWNDKAALLRFDTPKITFKNLEILPAIMRQEPFLYRGQPRHIMLTEQGFHSPEGEAGERLQAAAFAVAYYKIARLDGIDAFILHRHVSMRDEGGLDLGLWTWDRADPAGCRPGRKKLIWDVFRQADTPQQEAAFAFALPIAGLKSWDEALPKTRFDTTPAPPVAEDPVVADLFDRMSEAKLDNNSGFIPDEVILSAGWLAPAIFQHPPVQGVGRATYALSLPPVAPGERLTLKFHTMLTHDSPNGVRFSVLAGAKELWHDVQADQLPRAQTVDLTPWAGQAIALTLQVDAQGDPTNDWAHWVQPVVVRQAAATR